MNSDFGELLQTFNDHEVRYLVVGGYAVIHHAQPCYTDIEEIRREKSEELSAVDPLQIAS